MQSVSVPIWLLLKAAVQAERGLILHLSLDNLSCLAKYCAALSDSVQTSFSTAVKLSLNSHGFQRM